MRLFAQLQRSLQLAVPQVVENPRPDQADRYAGLLVFVSVFAIYLKTAAPTVTFGDSGELVTAAVTMGVPHPTGFPLYLLSGKLFTLVLPFGDLAFRLNVFSAIFGALTAAAVYFLVRALGQYKSLAVFAALFTGFLPTMWDHGTEAKVYTMAAFFVALALTLAIHGAWRRDLRSSALAFLAAGLAAAVHFSGLLVLPALPLILLGADRRFLRSRLLWPLGCAAFLLPLLFYLYIPLRAAAGPGLNWSRPDSLERFVFYISQGQWSYKEFTRTPYQSWLALKQAAGLFISEFSAAGALLAMFGAWVLWHRRRFVLLGLLLLALLNLAMVVAYGNPDDLHLMYRYLLPAWLAGAACLALGAQYLVGLAANSLVRENRVPLPLFTALVWGLLIATPVVRGILLYPSQDKSGWTPAADHARNMLSTMPTGSHLVAFHYLDLFPLLYITRVEGLRGDLVFHDRAGNLFGDEYDLYDWRHLPPDELQARLDGVDAAIIAGAGAPVFYTHRMNRTVRLEQAGILLAVAGTGWAGDPAEQFGTYRIRGEERIRQGRIWQDARQVLATYYLYEADMYRSWGLSGRAGEEYLHAAAIGYDSKWVLRYAAVALAAGGRAEEAGRLLRQAVALDPGDPGMRMAFGALLQGRGDHRGALEQYEACFRLGAPEAVLHNNLAAIRVAMGQRAEAVEHLRQALTLDPGYEEARRNLAALETPPENPAPLSRQ
jgi:tetratricopeptide (TPR) repeat protein